MVRLQTCKLSLCRQLLDRVPCGYICINNHLPNSDLLLKVFEGSMAYYILYSLICSYETLLHIMLPM